MIYDPLHPQPCFLSVQLVHRGPMTAGRIWRECICTVNGPDVHEWEDTCDRFPGLCAEAHGQGVSVAKLWRTVCATHNDVHLEDSYGHSAALIEERMWKYLDELREWAELPGNEDEALNHPWAPILTSQIAMDTADRKGQKYTDLALIKPIFGGNG